MYVSTTLETGLLGFSGEGLFLARYPVMPLGFCEERGGG